MVELITGDNLEVLARFEPDSLDSCVVDPPYGLSEHKPQDVVDCLRAWLAGKPYTKRGAGFMSWSWDAWVPGPEIWREVYRVLKPGGYILVFASTRSVDLMGVALRLAGFIPRELIAWLNFTGFPHGVRADLAVDAYLGVESRVVGRQPQTGAKFTAETIANGGFNNPDRQDFARKEATSPEAQTWKGFNTSLKPAIKPIILARKPMIGTLAENLLAHGTGALNIDACRIGDRRQQRVWRGSDRGRGVYGVFAHDQAERATVFSYDTGRWPSNVVLSHGPSCKRLGTRTVRGDGHSPAVRGSHAGTWSEGSGLHKGSTAPERVYDHEEVETWACEPGCPVAELNRQAGRKKGSRPIARYVGQKQFTGRVYSGGQTRTQDYASPGYEDDGEPSRFFMQFQYCSKASRAERDAGCSDLPARTGGELTHRQEGSAGLNNPRAGAGRTSGGKNHHPTVKPIELMRYLVKLVTPPGGTVLDCFLGSGSTGVAAVLEGFDFVGIEKEAAYMTIAEARILHAWGQQP